MNGRGPCKRCQGNVLTLAQEGRLSLPPTAPSIPATSLLPCPHPAPLTFFLGFVFLHPIRHLPQGVKEEVSLLLADDLGWVGRKAEGRVQVEGLPGESPPGGAEGLGPARPPMAWEAGRCSELALTCPHIALPHKLTSLHPDSPCAVRGLAQYTGETATYTRHTPAFPATPGPPSRLHLVSDLDEEAAAFPGGQLQPGDDALAYVPHPAVGAHLQHLGGEAVGERLRTRLTASQPGAVSP